MPETSPLKRILEAALLASAQPLTLPQMAGLFDEFEMPTQDDLARAIGELQQDAAGRGVELVEVASGFRYQVCQDVHAFVSRLWSERQTRYTRALLETLSLIAYRQPITRAEIEQIRGVAVSTNIVRTLEEREWVRVVGYRDLPGKPALFGTTKQFLDYFSLKSLDQLPPLSEIRDIEDLDPQFAFDGPPPPIPASIELEPDDEEVDDPVASAASAHDDDDSAAEDVRPDHVPDSATESLPDASAAAPADDAEASPPSSSSSAEPVPGAPPEGTTETPA